MGNFKNKMKNDKLFKALIVVGIALLVLDLIFVGYCVLDSLIINGVPLIKNSTLKTATIGKIVFAINFIGIAIPALAYAYKQRSKKVQTDDETKSH